MDTKVNELLYNVFTCLYYLVVSIFRLQVVYFCLFKGAMFPWESALTGLETSPGEVYGKNQNHITGDIAYAAKLYWWTTKDRQWLRQYGYQLAKDTAEFWASRVQYRSDVDRYVINHVMPPDEYQYPINNSVYTNVVAKLNLEFAIKV